MESLRGSCVDDDDIMLIKALKVSQIRISCSTWSIRCNLENWSEFFNPQNAIADNRQHLLNACVAGIILNLFT